MNLMEKQFSLNRGASKKQFPISWKTFRPAVALPKILILQEGLFSELSRALPERMIRATQAQEIMRTLNRLLTPLIAALIVMLAGCKTAGHISPKTASKISIGMTKAELTKAIGGPEMVSAEGQTEVLTYTVERPWWAWKRLRVKIVDGKVESYQ